MCRLIYFTRRLLMVPSVLCVMDVLIVLYIHFGNASMLKRYENCLFLLFCSLNWCLLFVDTWNYIQQACMILSLASLVTLVGLFGIAELREFMGRLVDIHIGILCGSIYYMRNFTKAWVSLWTISQEKTDHGVKWEKPLRGFVKINRDVRLNSRRKDW